MINIILDVMFVVTNGKQEEIIFLIQEELVVAKNAQWQN
jgi:hypothetical protein